MTYAVDKCDFRKMNPNPGKDVSGRNCSYGHPIIVYQLYFLVHLFTFMCLTVRKTVACRNKIVL